MNDARALWARYQQFLVVCPSIGLSLDVSRMRFDDAFLERMRVPIATAIDDMAALERGAVANPDEKRMVGHYWLRDPERAPRGEIKDAIRATQARIVAFAASVHDGKLAPERGGRFINLLVVGIGGSALGPEFVAAALGGAGDKMRPFFLDNTDPDGFDRVFHAIGAGIAQTLTVVISKSGGTKETRNGMLAAAAAYRRAGLSFARHATAVTGEGSELDEKAKTDGWLARFPMWDWVGGRTSELSAVGLLPAALQGIDIEAMLAGARDADVATRAEKVFDNPAAVLALMWYFAGDGQGKKAMVVLPYKDRLELFSRYLQQLVMESLGKERNLEGKVVHQGLVVYGNKGSTDQHAYVQQLRDGLNNFFVTFVRVLRDGAPSSDGASLEVEPGVTSGDYLDGFLLGTRQALYENERDSILLTLDEVGPRAVGTLIAIYERTVGLYASLIGVNAYHQPGVEAGKKAAAEILRLEGRVFSALAQASGEPLDAEQVAARLGADADAETVYHVLEHLAANPGRGVQRSSDAPGGSAGAKRGPESGAPNAAGPSSARFKLG
jgi:glucose-6-phosphate isomerase